MPPGAVYVGRPTKYANYADWKRIGRAAAVEDFRRQLRNWKQDDLEGFERMLEELRGKDLCCWCPLGQPCHADVLLVLANA